MGLNFGFASCGQAPLQLCCSLRSRSDPARESRRLFMRSHFHRHLLDESPPMHQWHQVAIAEERLRLRPALSRSTRRSAALYATDAIMNNLFARSGDRLRPRCLAGGLTNSTSSTRTPRNVPVGTVQALGLTPVGCRAQSLPAAARIGPDPQSGRSRNLPALILLASHGPGQYP